MMTTIADKARELAHERQSAACLAIAEAIAKIEALGDDADALEARVFARQAAKALTKRGLR